MFRVQLDRGTRKSGPGRHSGFEFEKIGRWFLRIYPTLVATELCRNLFSGTDSFGNRCWRTFLSYYRKNPGTILNLEEETLSRKRFISNKSVLTFSFIAIQFSDKNGACVFDSLNKLPPKGPNLGLLGCTKSYWVRGRPNKCEYSTIRFEVRLGCKPSEIWNLGVSLLKKNWWFTP